jgi:hypothetical protein
MISHERKEKMISYQGKRRGDREGHITSRKEKRKDVKATPVTITIHSPLFIDFLF